VDVIVIGAGLIGLGIARELRARGAEVTVVDRDEPAAAASWAAAGMLAPFTEAIESSHLERLCARSLELYPRFTSALAVESGVDANLDLSGILQVAYSDEGAQRLRGRAEELTAQGCAADALDAATVRELDPVLSPAVRGGLFVDGEGQVDNRLLGRALQASCRKSGVRVVADAGTVAIEADSRRVRGVRTRHGFMTAPVVVIAAGAWSAIVPGLPESVRPAVFPVKGQMLALATPLPFLRHVTWAPGAYLVPRRDGRLLVGATVEHAGFDLHVTAAGIRALLDPAIEAIPALGELALVETWSGLRPGSSDGLPFVGRTLLEGLYLATGHHRNGVLLTPITAGAIADLIEDRSVAEEVAACSPLRAQEQLARSAN